MFWNNRNKICPKKPSFKKLLQILIIRSSIFCAIKTAWGWKFSASHKSYTPIYAGQIKRAKMTKIRLIRLPAAVCSLKIFISGWWHATWNYTNSFTLTSCSSSIMDLFRRKMHAACQNYPLLPAACPLTITETLACMNF